MAYLLTDLKKTNKQKKNLLDQIKNKLCLFASELKTERGIERLRSNCREQQSSSKQAELETEWQHSLSRGGRLREEGGMLVVESM